jgi:hypothetical protein
MIEFNDNGSGFLFAALINYFYVESLGMADLGALVPPPADLIAT